MGLRQRRLGEDLASQYRGKVAHLKTSISILLINCHPLPIFRTSYIPSLVPHSSRALPCLHPRRSIAMHRCPPTTHPCPSHRRLKRPRPASSATSRPFAPLQLFLHPSHQPRSPLHPTTLPRQVPLRPLRPLLTSYLHQLPRPLATSQQQTPDEDFDEDWEEYDPKNGPFIHHMIAGSMAGFVEHAGMYPVDWAKTHLQANRHATTQQMESFFKKQPLRTMYRGVGAVFAGVVPAHSAYYSIYEVAKDRFGANRQGHHPIAAAASGAVATIAHDIVMTPLDVVKQRMQLGMYKGVLHAINVIVKTEGLSSLVM